VATAESERHLFREDERCDHGCGIAPRGGRWASCRGSFDDT